MQLCYITDRRQLPGDGAAQARLLLQKIAQATTCGVEWIQLREKDMESGPLERLAAQAVELVHAARLAGSPTRLLVSSRVDVALAVGTDGLHLPAHGLTIEEARAVITRSSTESSRMAIGVSCHREAEVAAAVAAGASLILFAPVFGKVAAPQVPATGVDGLQHAVSAADGMPVFALGGVTLSNAASCLAAGASGVAGIRLFQEGDLAATVQALRDLP